MIANNNVEPIRTETPNRRLVTVTNLVQDREVIFIEVHFPELVDSIISAMIGDMIYAAALGMKYEEQVERVMVSFTEEVGDKEIDIGPPTGFIEALSDKVETEINPTLIKLNMQFGFIVGESHLEFSLTVIDEPSQTDEGEEEL